MGKDTILVIDDHEINRKLIRKLLQMGEYTLLEAGDAETGLPLAREHRPAVILMDIQLPGMDGLEATRQIVNDADLKNTPVVALTAHAMKGDEDKALEAGCVGYITKPIDTRTFLDSVAHFKTQSRRSRADRRDYRHRILVVDDEPLNIKLLASILPKDRYDVLIANDGQTGLEKTFSEHPDLVLLDVMMPGINGYEVTRKLKNDPDTKHIPIMLVTALDGKDEKVKGLEAGADDFLNKPINPSELLARVQSMLRLKVYQEQLKTRAQSEKFVLTANVSEDAAATSTESSLILLVEDNPVDARLFQKYLEKTRYRLKVVKDGEEALEVIQSEPVDLILLDLMLPGMDGFEVIEHIKTMTRHRNVPVVMVTSRDDMQSKIRGINLGADDYLVKPVNRDELNARIEALLKKKAYMDQLSSRFESALQAAISDKLTGIYNHAYLKHFLAQEIKRAQRQKHPLALIMIDIDDFKKYNDTYGHPAGDELLNWLGRRIKKITREIDVPARYGGEEFAVVLPYEDQNGASLAAGRIHESIGKDPFQPSGSLQPRPVTVSMGIAAYPRDATTTEELIQKADAALYQAKREGKDRICIFDNRTGYTEPETVFGDRSTLKTCQPNEQVEIGNR